MAGCPSSHHPTRNREETLESGGPLQRKLNFRLRTSRYSIIKVIGQTAPEEKVLFKQLKIKWTIKLDSLARNTSSNQHNARKQRKKLQHT